MARKFSVLLLLLLLVIMHKLFGHGFLIKTNKEPYDLNKKQFGKIVSSEVFFRMVFLLQLEF